MKKVLFVATVDSHIKQFHLPYLKWFKEKGYEVHVATNTNSDISYCDKKHSIQIHRSPFKISNIKAIGKLQQIIKEEKYDIVHCHTPMGGTIARISARKARKTQGTKVMYTAHGFHFFKGAPFLNWLMYYPVEKVLSKITDCLITINEEDYELTKSKFYTKQIELVNGVGVDKHKFDFVMSEEEKHQLRQTLEIEDDDFVIIYPAELSKRKNQGMLIKAIKELKNENYNNIKLLLPGFDSMNGYYQKMSKELGLDKEIMFLGYRTDIPNLMKLSNLLVSTSRQEGLPVNLIEAVFCQLPIIATNCRGNRDVVSRYHKGTSIEIKDMVGLSSKIKEYMDQNSTAKQQKESNQGEVSIFELENVLKEMEAIYEK